MANTFYAIVPECEHTGDLELTVRGLRAIGCRVTHQSANCGEYETGCVTFTTDDDLKTLREKAEKQAVATTFDGETVNLADECGLTAHQPDNAW